MASTTSTSSLWESLHETRETKLCSEIEIDRDLMAFLEESQVGNEEEEEKLRCVIQSLQDEIEHNNLVAPEEFVSPELHENRGIAMPEGSEADHSLSSYPIDEPFDWDDMEMVSNSMDHHDMDQWYMDACMDEMGINMHHHDQLSYVDGVRDHSFHNAEALIECEYSPLWEEKAWN